MSNIAGWSSMLGAGIGALDSVATPGGTGLGAFASGAGSGAAMGASLGTLGAGVGALIGGGASLLGHRAEQRRMEEAKKQEEEAKRAAELSVRKGRQADLNSRFNVDGMNVPGFYAKGGNVPSENNDRLPSWQQRVNRTLINTTTSLAKGRLNPDLQGKSNDDLYRYVIKNYGDLLPSDLSHFSKKDSYDSFISHIAGSRKYMNAVRKGSTSFLRDEGISSVLDEVGMDAAAIRERVRKKNSAEFGDGGEVPKRQSVKDRLFMAGARIGEKLNNSDVNVPIPRIVNRMVYNRVPPAVYPDGEDLSPGVSPVEGYAEQYRKKRVRSPRDYERNIAPIYDQIEELRNKAGLGTRVNESLNIPNIRNIESQFNMSPEDQDDITDPKLRERVLKKAEKVSNATKGFGIEDEDMWRHFMGYRQAHDTLEPSPFQRQEGQSAFRIKDPEFRKHLINERNIERLKRHDGRISGDTHNMHTFSHTGLARYTQELGEDEIGKYLAYYDIYDFDDMPLLDKIGKPYTIYDRIYYDYGSGNREEKVNSLWNQLDVLEAKEKMSDEDRRKAEEIREKINQLNISMHTGTQVHKRTDIEEPPVDFSNFGRRDLRNTGVSRKDIRQQRRENRQQKKAYGGNVGGSYLAEGGETIEHDPFALPETFNGNLGRLSSDMSEIQGPSHDSKAGGVLMSGGDRIFSDQIALSPEAVKYFKKRV